MLVHRARGILLALLWAMLSTTGQAQTLGEATLCDESSLVADVFRLLDERLRLMPGVAAAKWQTHGAISDPAREAVVIAAAGSRARALGLSPEPVEDVFKVQIRLAVELQTRLTAHWVQDGYEYPGVVPDLAKDLRPRLDALTEEILTSLYLATPGLAALPSEELDRLALRGLPVERWADADRKTMVDALRRLALVEHGSWSRARAVGILRVGTPGDYAPFSAIHAGYLLGSDVELVQALARQLGVRVVFIRSSWKTLLRDLSEDQFDLAVGGISLTPVRLAIAEGSIPLAHSGKTALGRCADRNKLSTLAAIDRPLVVVVENPGGTNEAFARGHLTHAQLRVHGDNVTVFNEIMEHRADVMFTDETEVDLQTRRQPSLCRLTLKAFEMADKGFLWMASGGWAPLVNPWLKAQQQQGVPERLLQRSVEAFAGF